MTETGEDGYIMASALAALFAMSLVAAALVSVSGSALSRVTRMETSVQDRYAVEAAIRLAASQLAVDPRRRTLPFEEGAENLEVGDRSIDVRASWEGMRLDVNRAPPEAIDLALQKTTIGELDRRDIMAAVRTAQSIGLPIAMLEQLELAPHLMACVSDTLTVFGGQLEFNPDQETRALSGRPGAGARIRLDAKPASGGPGRTAILMMTGDGRDPYRVLDWRELRGNPSEACNAA